MELIGLLNSSIISNDLTHMVNFLIWIPDCDWGSYIISIAKTASMKSGALICSMKSLPPEVALYLYKYGVLLIIKAAICSRC